MHGERLKLDKELLLLLSSFICFNKCVIDIAWAEDVRKTILLKCIPQVGTDNADENEMFTSAGLTYDSVNFLDAAVLPEQTEGLAKIFEELGHFQRQVKDDPDIDLLKVSIVISSSQLTSWCKNC